MPELVVVAGLAIGAVLGTGLLCLGTYLAHRYVDLQCRKINKWLQRIALRMGHVNDIESVGKRSGTTYNRDGGLHSAIKKQAPTPGKSTNHETQNVTRLRDGQGYREPGNVSSWANEGQIQTRIPKPALQYAQSAGRPRALGWGQHIAEYNQLWHAPAVFQQAMPGTFYAYVAPEPDVAKSYRRSPFGQAGAYKGWFDHMNSRPLSNRGTYDIGDCSAPIHAAPSRDQLKTEPVAFESDCIDIVEQHPPFIENQSKGKFKKGIKKKSYVTEQSDLSSSTDLGTISSSPSSASTEDVLRVSIPVEIPRRTHLLPQSYRQYPEYGKGTACVQVGRNSYTRKPKGGERWQEPSNDDVQPKSRRRPSVRSRWQATGRTASGVDMRGKRANSDAFSESRCEGKGPVQSRNAARDPSGMKSTGGKSGSAGKRGSVRVPDRSGRTAQPASPTKSELHNIRVEVIAGAGMPHVVFKKPWRICSQTELTFDISPAQSETREPIVSTAESDIRRLASRPVSPINNATTSAK